MIGKCFDRDKNYILKQAQKDLAHQVVRESIPHIVNLYLQQSNPLGLEDDFTNYLISTKKINYDFLIPSYTLLCNIFRRIHSDNQLEFLWDGSTHYDKYVVDWRKSYHNWQKELCRNPKYTLSVIKGTFLYEGITTEFLEKEIEKQILKHFKVSKDRKGYLSIAA